MGKFLFSQTWPIWLPAFQKQRAPFGQRLRSGFAIALLASNVMAAKAAITKAAGFNLRIIDAADFMFLLILLYRSAINAESFGSTNKY